MNQGKSEPDTLKREFGLITVTLLVVGLLVGSGVFQKIIPMAKTGLSGFYILLAWFVAGILSLLGAFTVGGLASVTEDSGGTYEYFRISFGKLFAFISGWADFMVIGTGASAAIAFLFAQSVNHIIPIPNPLSSLDAVSIGNFIFPFKDFGIKIVAVITIVILTAINAIGTKESGIINNVITSVKVLGIICIILLGLFLPVKVQASAQVPVINSGSLSQITFISVFIGMVVEALWAYEGWAFAANVTGEIKNPRRNIPIALSLGIGITMVIYVLANYVYMHVLPLSTLASVNEIEVGAVVVTEALLGRIGKVFILILVIICTLGAINSNVISLPRKYFRMAQEGSFFRNAGRVSPRFHTPVNSLVYSMIWTCLLIFSGSFEMLSNLVIFIGYIFYGMLGVALIKLKLNGTIKGKVFGYPFAPIAFLILSAALTVNEIYMNPKQSLLGLLLTLSGIPFYFLFRAMSGKSSVTSEIEPQK